MQNSNETCSFLNFIEHEIKKHPELIQPISKKEMEEVSKLVECVDLNDTEES